MSVETDFRARLQKKTTESAKQKNGSSLNAAAVHREKTGSAAAFSFPKENSQTGVAARPQFPKDDAAKQGALNVAAYIRVSTNSSDQENSYEAQERYFNRLIEINPEWRAVGVYADHGVSGTNGEKRTGFRRLLRHCGQGKIDRILCKSISRFARNTADFMSALRMLKENHVTILFEKENLDTADPTNEFILTTLGAIAQEESRSISGNISLGNQMRFRRGDVRNEAIYGYRYTGQWIIHESGYPFRAVEVVEEEAAIVRRIFREIAGGNAYADVARKLNLERVPAPDSVSQRRRREKAKKGQLYSELEDGWTSGRISFMIRNERYAGDVVAQKTYTADCLTHTVRRNKGEVRQYHVKDHHPAIVSRALFETVQEIAAANSSIYRRERRTKRAFSGRLICEACGRFYHVRNTQGEHPIWFCPSAALNNGRSVCRAEKIYEEQVVRAIRRAVLERFQLCVWTMEDGVEAADIMGGRCTEMRAVLSPSADSFVPRMQARLENLQQMDFAERDRCFYKRQIERNRAESQALNEKLDSLEAYWEELEQDYDCREEALKWLKTLPEGRQGTMAFLDGLTGDYCKAFVLSVTIHSPLEFTVHWFDDSQTRVEMESQVED